MTTPEETPEETTELDEETRLMIVNRIGTPAHADVLKLRELIAERDHNLVQQFGDQAQVTEDEILSDCFKSDSLTYETTTKKLAEMRDALGWHEANELERLAIRQVCLTWLRLYYLEQVHHRKTSASHTNETGAYWDKRLTQSQRRHLKALETLARVQKLVAQKKKTESSIKRLRANHAISSLKVLEAITE